MTRFCLAQAWHHYVVYSASGSFKLTARGAGLKGHWFNPRDVNGMLRPAFDVKAGERVFTPPDTNADWVLWVTDEADLNSGAIHPSAGAMVVQEVVDKWEAIGRP